MGLVYDRDGCFLCAFTGRKVDDLRSWYTRQYTHEEADREKDAFLFMRFRKQYGCFGVLRQDGGKVEVNPPHIEDSFWGLMQSWFQDAVGARRCHGPDATQCVYGGQGTQVH